MNGFEWSGMKEQVGTGKTSIPQAESVLGEGKDTDRRGWT